MAKVRVPVRPEILLWAQARGRRSEDAIRRRFPMWDAWLAGERQPTFRQAGELAAYTHVPFGALLLRDPPRVSLPIRDFRVGRGPGEEPSQDLLAVIGLSQRRQAWYRDYAQENGLPEVPAVGSARNWTVARAAADMTEALGFEVDRRAAMRGADDARRHLVGAFEALGGLVVVSSMVGNDNHRMLDVEEFRGFTLHDPLAPFVFVNASDTMAAQVFSLLHEFAHVWRGEGGVSGDWLEASGGDDTERWCNAVAAEVAVPAMDLRERFRGGSLTPELDRLAKVYKCSTLVARV